MISAFQSREYDWGYDVDDNTLSKINRSREKSRSGGSYGLFGRFTQATHQRISHCNLLYNQALTRRVIGITNIWLSSLRMWLTSSKSFIQTTTFFSSVITKLGTGRKYFAVLTPCPLNEQELWWCPASHATVQDTPGGRITGTRGEYY